MGDEEIKYGMIKKKKLTVTIDEEIYNWLHAVIGPRKISRFIEELVRPHVVRKDMYAAYKAMADDRAREAEALECGLKHIGVVSLHQVALHAPRPSISIFCSESPSAQFRLV